MARGDNARNIAKKHREDAKKLSKDDPMRKNLEDMAKTKEGVADDLDALEERTGDPGVSGF